MDQLWGLSGPQFIALYIAGYIASLVIMFVVQTVLTRTDTRAADTGTLDVYQTAYLAGGPPRVVETAIAGLVLREQILVARRGRLTAVQGARPFGPVEAAVCQELTQTASLKRVLSRLRRHPCVDVIADQVRSRGLLVSSSRVLLWRLALLFLPVALWCVGLARAINGAYLGRPIGDLTFLLLIITALAVLIPRRIVARNQLSAAGRSAVRQLRQRHRTGPTPDIETQVAGVAVLGFTALADPALRHELFVSTGSGRGGGGGGGGGGCGGGGCGG